MHDKSEGHGVVKGEEEGPSMPVIGGRQDEASNSHVSEERNSSSVIRS